MSVPVSRPPAVALRRRAAPLALGAALLAGALLPAPAAAPAYAEGNSAQLVEDANRKVRQRDTKGAIQLLELAIQADPTNVDAHIRYQDVARDAVGVAALRQKYADAAKAKPDDPVAQFLATRLLDPSKAAETYEQLLSKSKASPWLWAGRARALEEMGRWTDATAAHAEAVNRAGDGGLRFVAYRAYCYERGSQWTLAAEAWNQVIAKSPKDLSARLGLAEALRRNGDYDDSLAALEAASKAGVADPEIAYRRALVQVDQKNWDKALESFEAALAGDRGMLEALCGACEAAIRKGKAAVVKEQRAPEEKDFDPAVSYGDRAVIAWPDSPYAHFVLGAAHEAAIETNPDGHIELALREYDAALERLPIPGPEKVRALTAKAFIQLQKAEWSSALETAQRAIDIDPACVTAYGHAAHALCADGKQQEAIAKYYKPGLKADPKCARLLHDMGIALWELGKVNDAKKALEDARTIDPKSGRYRLSIGELYYALKRYKDSVAELFEATELLPRDRWAWGSYARACYAAKYWAECVTAYEKVTQLDPDCVDEWLYIAVVASDQLKDKDKAKKAVMKFKEKGGSDPNLDDWINQLLEDTGK